MGERNGEGNGSRGFFKRLARRHLAALSLAGLVLLVVTAAALAVTGDLTQPAGTAGCVSEDGSGPCANGHALELPNSVAVSADGKNVYVASGVSDAVTRFNRNPNTGAVTQPAGSAGCVSRTGAGPCADGHALNNPVSVAVSADGKSVYVASDGSNAVAHFVRNTSTGAITQPAGRDGCVSESGAAVCANGHGLDDPVSVAVSADGKNVYLASVGTGAVVRLNRNTTTGALSQPAGSAGCVSDDGSGPCADGHGIGGPFGVAVSVDGKSVYLASIGSNAVVRFDRNATTGAITQPGGAAGCVSETGAGPCANGHGLSGAQGVAVSPDGKSVYVVSGFGIGSDAVARLNRNTTTGAITQPAGTAGCVSERQSEQCAQGHALARPEGVVVSADGKNVYVASAESNALARLNRNITTGGISQPAGTAGCVGLSEGCGIGRTLITPGSVAVSADGKSVYVASRSSDAVARFNRAP